MRDPSPGSLSRRPADRRERRVGSLTRFSAAVADGACAMRRGACPLERAWHENTNLLEFRAVVQRRPAPPIGVTHGARGTSALRPTFYVRRGESGTHMLHLSPLCDRGRSFSRFDRSAASKRHFPSRVGAHRRVSGGSRVSRTRMEGGMKRTYSRSDEEGLAMPQKKAAPLHELRERAILDAPPAIELGRPHERRVVRGADGLPSPATARDVGRARVRRVRPGFDRARRARAGAWSTCRRATKARARTCCATAFLPSWWWWTRGARGVARTPSASLPAPPPRARSRPRGKSSRSPLASRRRVRGPSRARAHASPSRVARPRRGFVADTPVYVWATAGRARALSDAQQSQPGAP